MCQKDQPESAALVDAKNFYDAKSDYKSYEIVADEYLRGDLVYDRKLIEERLNITPIK